MNPLELHFVDNVTVHRTIENAKLLNWLANSFYRGTGKTFTYGCKPSDYVNDSVGNIFIIMHILWNFCMNKA